MIWNFLSIILSLLMCLNQWEVIYYLYRKFLRFIQQVITIDFIKNFLCFKYYIYISLSLYYSPQLKYYCFLSAFQIVITDQYLNFATFVSLSLLSEPNSWVLRKTWKSFSIGTYTHVYNSSGRRNTFAKSTSHHSSESWSKDVLWSAHSSQFHPNCLALL